tara:strand:+ start:557 stop:754 length:198 start_codon:yes stop_codon:yes gene_type:complete
MKIIITIIGIISFIILSTLSYHLMQDIQDPITKRTVRDPEARKLGIIGYMISIFIIIGLCRYILG